MFIVWGHSTDTVETGTYCSMCPEVASNCMRMQCWCPNLDTCSVHWRRGGESYNDGKVK